MQDHAQLRSALIGIATQLETLFKRDPSFRSIPELNEIQAIARYQFDVSPASHITPSSTRASDTKGAAGVRGAPRSRG